MPSRAPPTHHLALNDPPAGCSTDQVIHTVTLNERCRMRQVGEGHFHSLDDVPGQAYWLTVPALLAAQFGSTQPGTVDRGEAKQGLPGGG